MPPMIVAPERDVPGMSANDCASPIFNASFHVISSTLSTRATERAALDPENDERADHESQSDRNRVEQMRFDQTAEDEAQHCGGNECDHQIDDEALCDGIAADARERPREPRSIFPHDREHRTGLDGDLEDLAFLVVKTEELARDDQVARARDRKKLREAFHDAEDDRLQENQGIHGALILRADRLLVG